jgi:hypothetical protein
MRHPLSTLALASLLFSGALPNVTEAGPMADDAIIAAMKSVDPARMRADDEKLVIFGTRNTFSEDQGPNRGVFAARDWIKAQFDEIAATTNGRMRVEIDTFMQPADGNRIVRDVAISNVIATLKGSEDSTRTYVISSHYDSRNSSNSDAVKDAPGADDNASGVIVVLAAARALASLPMKATVIFTAYGAEEQGLKGSAHHAKALKAAGIDVQGDLNNDIVGASLGPKGEKNPHLVRIFSEALPVGADMARINNVGGENDSPSRQLARYAKEIGDGLAKPMTGDLIYRTDRYLRGGDHMSFYAQGFPAIRFVEAVENFAHQHNDVRVENGVQYGDLGQYVDFDYTARVARYNIAVLANLALAPPPPTGVVLLTKDLTNDSDLKWQAAPGASVYEIVARKTAETYWHSAATVTGTSAQLPLSKDNYLFAVRSIDSEGHKSPAAFPTPER